MKKHLFLLLIIPYQLLAQEINNLQDLKDSMGLPFDEQHSAKADRGVIAIYDSVHLFMYDTTDREFELNGRIIDIVYDGTRKTSEMQQKLVNGSWENFYFFRYFYSASGDADTTVRMKWLDEQWIYDYRIIRSLNADNNELSNLQQFWIDYEWRNSSARYLEYNEQGFVISLTYKNADANGVLVESVRHLTTYYTAYQVYTKTRQSWEQGTWIDEFRTVYKYIDNQRDTALYQYWIDGSWQTDYLDKYTYDAENMLDTIYSFNHESNFENNRISAYEHTDEYTETIITEKIDWMWQNKYKWRYNYDGTRLLFDYSWRWQNDQWELYSITHCSYDQSFLSGNSNMSYTWSVEGDSTHYYFHTVVGLMELPVTNLHIYPNPTTGLFNIAEVEQIQKIEIYNILGVPVKTIFHCTGTVDLSSHPAGPYFLKIHKKDGVFTGKVVIM